MMRRKSARNAQKATPEKPVKEAEVPKTRRSRRRKRSPSKSSDSDEEVLTITKRTPLEETPDTTTKSHTPSDDDNSEEPVWKVTSAEDTPKGEIQKLRISLTRPSPDSPEKTKSRRSKSNSQTEDDATSSEDKSTTRRTRSRGSPFIRNDGFTSQGDEEVEEKKGKGKSKGKHKSKIETSPQLSEPEVKPNSEISENVQVTPQSPSIDKPVDNENDYKVDVHDKQSVDDRQENVAEESGSNGCSSRNELVPPKDSQRDSDDDQPLSVIQKLKNVKQKVDEQDPQSTQTEETLKDVQGQSSHEDVQGQSLNEAAQKQSLNEAAQEQSLNEAAQEQSLNEATQEQSLNETAQEQSLNETAQEQSLNEAAQEPSLNEDVQEPSLNEDVRQTEEAATLVAEQQDLGEIQTVVESEPTAEMEPSPEREAVNSDLTKSSDLQSKDCENEQHEDVVQNAKPVEVTEADTESIRIEPREEDKSEDNIFVKEHHSEVESEPLSKSSDNSAAPKDVTMEANQPGIEQLSQVPRRKLIRDKSCLNADLKKDEAAICDRIKPSRNSRVWIMPSPSSFIKVDLNAIQDIWPSIEFPEEPDLHLDVFRERRKSSTETSAKKAERKVSVDYKSDSSDRPNYEKQSSLGSGTQDAEDNSNIIAFNRKISIVDDTASKLKPPPSPAKNPPSAVLYITNLVRPFTLKQLKELLERTGKIQEAGFWTDRIKSKCYVHYETQEEAEATRNALHGVQWPIGNGKKLIIEFATEEDLNHAKNPPAPPPPPQPTVPEDVDILSKENVEPMETDERSEVKTTSKEIEKKRNEGPVREWDIGKKEFHKERSRSRERGRKHRRSATPTDDFITRKQRKTEESVPQKLMDDLFLKTKATPSIYWQPLSPEEIAMKQQQRLIRMEEHKRRMEENTRLKGREMGRGVFRRRYD